MNLPTRVFLPWKRAAARGQVLSFIAELLRGFGQVTFQNSPIAGLCFLIGLCIGGWLRVARHGSQHAGWRARLGSEGHAHGDSGTLVGVPLAFYLDGNELLPVFVIFGGIVSAIVARDVGNVLATWQVPALTGPFVVTTWFFALGIHGLDQLQAGTDSGGPALRAVTSGSRAQLDRALIPDGLFHGVSQVFLRDSVIVGEVLAAGRATRRRPAARFPA